METEVLRAEAIVGEAASEFDRLILDMRDIPSTSAAMSRLVELLRCYRAQLSDGGWRFFVELLRRHELGRLLRTDPMVRRCQWHQADADPYDIVEAFVRPIVAARRRNADANDEKELRAAELGKRIDGPDEFAVSFVAD